MVRTLPAARGQDPEYEELFCRLGDWVYNHRASNILDHAKSEQHTASMAYMRANHAKAQGKPVETYAPIARSLLVLDDSEKRKMTRTFDICYVLAREGLAFLKYPSFHALAVHQGVELGSAYKRSDCAKAFTHFIAEAQRKQFLDSLSVMRFFSFLCYSHLFWLNCDVRPCPHNDLT